MLCWECGQDRKMHTACETCGAPARKPPATCEECGNRFRRGQNIVWTEREPVRYWHVDCLNSSLTPLGQWPRNERK